MLYAFVHVDFDYCIHHLGSEQKHRTKGRAKTIGCSATTIVAAMEEEETKGKGSVEEPEH
jgi:hypothetical protein